MTKRQLLISISALFFGAAIIAGALFFASLQGAKNKQAAARQLAEQVAEAVAAEHFIILEQARSDLESLARDPGTVSTDISRCTNTLARFLEARAERHDIFLRIRPDGMVDCAPKALAKAIDFSHRVYFTRVMAEKRFVVGEFLIGKVSKKPVLAVASPVFDNTGEVRYVIVTGLKTEWINQLIAEQAHNMEMGLELFDARGTSLSSFASSPETQEKIAARSSPLFTVQRSLEGEENGKFRAGIAVYVF